MRNKKYTIILSLLNVFEGITLLSIPYLCKELIDSAINGNKEFTLYYSLGLLASAIICVIFRVIYYFSYSSFTLKLEQKMKSYIFDSLSKKGFLDLSSYHSAEIEMLYTKDVDHIIGKKLSVIPSAVRIITRFTLAVALLLYYDYKFLIIVFVSGALALGAVRIYSKYMKPRHKKVLEESGKANSFIVEEKDSLKIIQAYQAEEYAKDYYSKLLDNQIKAKRSRNNLLYTGNSLFYLFSMLVYVGPLIYGAYGLLNSWFTYGVLVALTELVSQVENPLLQVSPLLNQYNMAKASEERLAKALEIKDMPNKDSNLDFDSIEFNNVSFSYDSDHQVIKNLNMTINKNDIVLLSGPSGIGKTTVFMLMMGFINPNEGKIVLKRSNEEIDMTIANIGLFSYVPQENVLFSGTIKDNLRILTGKDDDSIIDALKLANIYDELMAMPLGLDTMLKDKTTGLSLGQIQRILIACAILYDSPILLLDEFSSALDSANEDIIINNLKRLNKTIIYITHRNKHIDNQHIIELKEIE